MTDSTRFRERVPISYRLLLDRYAVLVGVVGILVLFGGVFLVYTTATAPETVTETETVTDGTWTVESEFTHGAEIQRDTAVFSEGDRLSNLPVYFAELAPRLDGEYTVRQRGDVSSVETVVTVEQVIRHVAEGENGEEVVFWRETEPVTTEEFRGSGGAPGEMNVSFEANVTTLGERVTTIENQIGASPGTTEVLLVVETTATGVVGEQELTESRESRLVIEPGAGTYSVETEVADPSTQEATRTIRQEVPNPEASSTPRLVGGSLLVLLGGVTAGGVGLGRYAGLTTVTREERRSYEYGQARETLDQWISRGRVPSDGAHETVELASLEDLVDVAIDSERRVIETTSDGVSYVVLVGETRYVFEPPAAVVEGAVVSGMVDTVDGTVVTNTEQADDVDENGRGETDGSAELVEAASGVDGETTDGAESETDKETENRSSTGEGS